MTLPPLNFLEIESCKKYFAYGKAAGFDGICDKFYSM